MTDAQVLNYHPSYAALDATLVLLSSDNVRFRVHTFILRMASSVFRNMLNDALDTGDPVGLEENSAVIKAILDYIYPNSQYFELKEQKFEDILGLLIAAKKYMIDKISQEFRARLISDSYFTEHPLEAYVIARRFGWENEAKEKSVDAIDHLNKFEVLQLSDLTSVLKLQKIAKVRKENLVKMVVQQVNQRYESELPYMNEPEIYEGSQYQKTRVTLTALVSGEMDIRPSGKGLQIQFWSDNMVQNLLRPERAMEMQQLVMDNIDRLSYNA